MSARALLPSKWTPTPTPPTTSRSGSCCATRIRAWIEEIAMNSSTRFIRTLLGLAFALIALTALAADYPEPKEGQWVVPAFKFHTGEVLKEVKLHYTTVGAPEGEPVLVMHGTTGSAKSMLTPGFAGQLFGPGEPLDASRYFIILPDALGHGKSSKPSDGLKTRFPSYNYDDLVTAAHRLVVERLGVHHLRLMIGNSMGGMETWMMAGKYPGFMDVAVPMASQPTEMSSRNWILRRLITDSIRNDPDWKGGNYTAQPKSAHFASVFFSFATSGGNQALLKAAPTREKADALLDARMKAPFTADPDDTLYQWDSSRDYNPSPGLERIRATLLAINSADDERNPPETGVLEREIRRVRNGRVLLIPGSPDTAGHGTTGSAKWWKKDLEELLRTAPKIGL